MDSLSLAADEIQGVGWDTLLTEGSLSPAEQEQRVLAALSLHPAALRVMHRAPATTTTRPHLPVAWGLGAGALQWKVAKELHEITVIRNK